MKYDVFISYSRKDVEIIDHIENELRKYGITCFVDRSEIALGEDFAEAISKAIFESDILLFVWSENSNQSENTANEIALAIDFEKTIISFKIGKFKPHYKLAYRLVRFNRIDVLSYNQPQIIELAEKVAKRLGKKINQAESQKPTPREEDTTSDKKTVEQEIIDPEMDPIYQDGIQALMQFKLSKAFDLLYPLALAEYRKAQEYLFRITRGKIRMHKLTEQQIAAVKEDADNGIALSQYIMGRYYYMAANSQLCIEYLQKAVESELPAAIGALANCYDLGFGTEKSHSKYMEYIQKAINMGDIESRLIQARNYINGWTVERDIEKGKRILLELEKLGDPQSIANLGFIYNSNEYNQKDVPKAISYFKKAVSSGWIESYSDLAFAYGLDTYGNVLDGKRYIEELLKGADYEEVTCLSNLSLAYYNGIGVKQNYKQALRWAEKGARNGDLSSYWLLGLMYYYGNDEIEADEAKAWDWLMKGKLRINTLCCSLLGDMCYDGYGQNGYQKKDCIPFYEEAVFLGGACNDAAVRLYNIYSEGVLTEKDPEKGLQYLKKAVDNNDPKACTIYGKLLTDLNNSYCDEFKGVKYLKIAAEANNYEAIYTLGTLFRQGIGVPEDVKTGIEHVKRAADEGNYGRAQIAMADILSHIPGPDNEWYDDERDKALSSEQIETERIEAIAYAEKAIENEYNYGHRIIARIYWEMAGNSNYEDEAINGEWFKRQTKAYEIYKEEAYTLALLYECGIGTPANFEKAIELYQEDVENGYSRSTISLAIMFAHTNNMKLAKEWLQKGVDMNNEEAKAKLEQLNRTGSF